MSTTPESKATRQAVRERYASIARDTMAETAEDSGTGCCAPSCCGTDGLDATTLAASIGYRLEDLSDLPAGANMGLSCGNPTSIASLQPGEVVLDLGSGGGFDLFLAGPKVGATGRAIGVDMTPDMLALARKNLQTYREVTGLDNVEFRLGEIEHLPMADASVDVVISNSVLNLSPDKPQVWHDIALMPKPDYVEVMRLKKLPLYEHIAAHIPEGTTPADYVTSLDITARKASS